MEMEVIATLRDMGIEGNVALACGYLTVGIFFLIILQLHGLVFGEPFLGRFWKVTPWRAVGVFILIIFLWLPALVLPIKKAREIGDKIGR